MVQPFWETFWQFFIKLNIQLPYNSYTLRCLSLKNENIQLHKNLSTNAPNSLSHDRRKLETTKMSLNRQMVKQTAGHSYHGISRELRCEKVNPQRLHTVWFQLHNTLDTENRLVVAGTKDGIERGEGRWVSMWMGDARDGWSDAAILYLNWSGRYRNTHFW